MNPEFLDMDDVLAIHERQLVRFGGSAGLRDSNHLDSAIAQPRAQFGGEFLHTDLWEMAAAYLFHIVKNHPFVDGNKRTGLVTALTFLGINGVSIPSESPRFYDITMAVAEGTLDKAGLTAILRELARS